MGWGLVTLGGALYALWEFLWSKLLRRKRGIFRAGLPAFAAGATGAPIFAALTVAVAVPGPPSSALTLMFGPAAGAALVAVVAGLLARRRERIRLFGTLPNARIALRPIYRRNTTLLLAPLLTGIVVIALGTTFYAQRANDAEARAKANEEIAAIDERVRALTPSDADAWPDPSFCLEYFGLRRLEPTQAAARPRYDELVALCKTRVDALTDGISDGRAKTAFLQRAASERVRAPASDTRHTLEDVRRLAGRPSRLALTHARTDAGNFVCAVLDDAARGRSVFELMRIDPDFVAHAAACIKHPSYLEMVGERDAGSRAPTQCASSLFIEIVDRAEYMKSHASDGPACRMPELTPVLLELPAGSTAKTRDALVDLVIENLVVSPQKPLPELVGCIDDAIRVEESSPVEVIVTTSASGAASSAESKASNAASACAARAMRSWAFPPTPFPATWTLKFRLRASPFATFDRESGGRDILLMGKPE